MFSVDDVGKRIANLGKKVDSEELSKEDIMAELREMRELLKNHIIPGTI